MAIAETPDVTEAFDTVFSSTSFTVSIPAGVTTGMLLVMGMTFANQQTNNSSVTSTGWTAFSSTQSVYTKWAFYKIASSTDQSNAGSGSWTVNCTDGFIVAGALAGWKEVDGTTPFDAGPTTFTDDSTTTWTLKSITVPSGGRVWVGIFVDGKDSGTITDPAGVVKQITGTSPYMDAEVRIYSKSKSAGATGDITGTIQSGFEFYTVALTLAPQATASSARLKSLLGVGQ